MQGTEHKFQPFARTDIEITGEELSNGHGSSGSPHSSGVTLQVRRGSESALNRLSPVLLSPPDPSKRWSAAPIIDEDLHEDSHRGKVSLDPLVFILDISSCSNLQFVIYYIVGFGC